MRRLLIVGALACCCAALATTPSYERQTADFSKPSRISQWDVWIKQGQVGYVLPFDFVNGQSGTTNVPIDLSGADVTLAMRDKYGVEAARLTGTNYGTYAEFTLSSNFVASSVQDWKLILVVEDGAKVYNQPSGKINIEPSPEIDSGDLVLQRSIGIGNYNWVGQFSPTNLPGAALNDYDDEDATNAVIAAWPDLDTDKTDDISVGATNLTYYYTKTQSDARYVNTGEVDSVTGAMILEDSAFTNLVRAAQTNDGYEADTTYLDDLASFTNAVRAAQTNDGYEANTDDQAALEVSSTGTYANVQAAINGLEAVDDTKLDTSTAAATYAALAAPTNEFTGVIKLTRGSTIGSNLTFNGAVQFINEARMMDGSTNLLSKWIKDAGGNVIIDSRQTGKHLYLRPTVAGVSESNNLYLCDQGGITIIGANGYSFNGGAAITSHVASGSADISSTNKTISPAAVKAIVDAYGGSGGGGSTARIVPVDSFYLNQAVKPSIIPLQDGSGDVRYYYEWDFEDVDRLDPIEVYAAAGTYAPVFSASAFVTNAVSQTNAVIIGYVNGSPNCTSAVVNLSAVTIDNYRTTGLLSVTGSVTLATGWHEFDARIDSVGGTNGLIYSRDINIDIGSAQ